MPTSTPTQFDEPLRLSGPPRCATPDDGEPRNATWATAASSLNQPVGEGVDDLAGRRRRRALHWHVDGGGRTVHRALVTVNAVEPSRGHRKSRQCFVVAVTVGPSTPPGRAAGARVVSISGATDDRRLRRGARGPHVEVGVAIGRFVAVYSGRTSSAQAGDGPGPSWRRRRSAPARTASLPVTRYTSGPARSSRRSRGRERPCQGGRGLSHRSCNDRRSASFRAGRGRVCPDSALDPVFRSLGWTPNATSVCTSIDGISIDAVASPGANDRTMGNSGVGLSSPPARSVVGVPVGRRAPHATDARRRRRRRSRSSSSPPPVPPPAADEVSPRRRSYTWAYSEPVPQLVGDEADVSRPITIRHPADPAITQRPVPRRGLASTGAIDGTGREGTGRVPGRRPRRRRGPPAGPIRSAPMDPVMELAAPSPCSAASRHWPASTCASSAARSSCCAARTAPASDDAAGVRGAAADRPRARHRARLRPRHAARRRAPARRPARPPQRAVPRPSVTENVRFWRATVGATADELAAAIERLGLAGRLADLPMRRLSAGQRRRTALACLVARRRSSGCSTSRTPGSTPPARRARRHAARRSGRRGDGDGGQPRARAAGSLATRAVDVVAGQVVESVP